MIRYLLSADRSLEANAEFIGVRNPDAAMRFIDAVHNAVNGLLDAPE